MTELEYDEEFVNPMLDAENKQLKLLIDLQTLKVVDWDGGNLRMWGKVRDFLPEFAEDEMRNARWRTFLKNIKYKEDLPFGTVMACIKEHLEQYWNKEFFSQE